MFAVSPFYHRTTNFSGARLGFARYGLAELVVFTLAFVTLTFLSAVLAVYVHGAFWLFALPVTLVWLEIVYFFRDPERTIPADAAALVSPADGTITNVEEVDDPDFQGGRALRISIFLSIFNVHINRLPRTGTIVQVRYFPARTSMREIRKAPYAMSSYGST